MKSTKIDDSTAFLHLFGRTVSGALGTFSFKIGHGKNIPMLGKHTNRWPDGKRQSAKHTGGLIKITISPLGVGGSIRALLYEKHENRRQLYILTTFQAEDAGRGGPGEMPQNG